MLATLYSVAKSAVQNPILSFCPWVSVISESVISVHGDWALQEIFPDSFFQIFRQMIVKWLQHAVHQQMVCWYLNCLYVFCYCSHLERNDDVLGGLLLSSKLLLDCVNRFNFKKDWRAKCLFWFCCQFTIRANVTLTGRMPSFQLSPTLPKIKTFWVDVSHVVV
jgi:hypothetical protein